MCQTKKDLNIGDANPDTLPTEQSINLGFKDIKVQMLLNLMSICSVTISFLLYSFCYLWKRYRDDYPLSFYFDFLVLGFSLFFWCKISQIFLMFLSMSL